jgi:hypothetical protein
MYIRSGSVSHYFPVGSQKLFFSRTGFVYVKNWKNSENSSLSQLCFLFVIYLRFIITLVKGMFDLQIDKYKKQKTKNCLQWIKAVKKNIVKIFYMWMFCITLKERNTKRFVQNWLRQVTFDRMVMILYKTCNSFSLFAMQLDYCNIQSVWTKVGTLTVYIDIK